MTLNPDQYRLTDAEHQATFDNDIKPDLFAGAKPSNQPVAVIFGGQPGAGKSAAVDAAMRELEQRGGAVQIIGDDLRGYHPEYASLMERDDKTAAFYTDRDTGRWVEKAIAHAKEQRVNIVIEGTMRDASKVAETMQSLRAAGYEIDARALAVNERLSQQGIIQRYENQKADRGTGRMTTQEAHQVAYAAMPATLERIERDKLADHVAVFRRGGEKLYQNDLIDGEWAHSPRARAAVEDERSRPMTLQERKSYFEGYEQLAAMVSKPERNASAEEIKTISELRMQAKRDYAAEAFKQMQPAEALKAHPELAGAYAAVASVEKRVAADGLNEQQRAVVMARVTSNVIKSIERGDVAEVKMKEEIEVKQDKSFDR